MRNSHGQGRDPLGGLAAAIIFVLAVAIALAVTASIAGSAEGADQGAELADRTRPHSVNSGGSESILVWCGLVPRTVVVENTRTEPQWRGATNHDMTTTGTNPTLTKAPPTVEHYPANGVVLAILDGATEVVAEWGGVSRAVLDVTGCAALEPEPEPTPTTQAPTPTTQPAPEPEPEPTPTPTTQPTPTPTPTTQAPTPTTQPTEVEDHAIGTATTPASLPATGSGSTAPLIALGTLSLIAGAGLVARTGRR